MKFSYFCVILTREGENMKYKIYHSKTDMSKTNKSYLEELIANYHGIVGNKLEDVLDKKDGRFVICLYDKYDDMCGFVSVIESENSINISDAYIEFGASEKSIEKKIISKIVEIAEMKKKHFVDVQVAVKNNEIRKIYEDLGFYYNSSSVNKYITMKKFVSHDVQKSGGFLFFIETLEGKENFAESVRQHLLATDINERTERICAAAKIIESKDNNGLKDVDEDTKLYVESYKLCKNHDKISKIINAKAGEKLK